MQTRQLRLGDVVDDYCPRERRLSNHVVVAMVEDAIKQTRCSTCDFEHPYKDGKVPPKRKKKDAPSALFQQVLDGVMEGRVLSPAPALVAPAPAPVVTPAPVPAPAAAVAVAVVEEEEAAPPPSPAPIKRRATRTRFVPEEPLPEPVPAPVVAAPVAAPVAAAPTPILRGVLRPANGLTAPPAAAAQTAASASPASATPSPDTSAAPQDPASEPMAVEDPEDGPLYRRNLIRATLPRPVGEVPVRQIPSFTIREAAAARPNKFRPKHRPQGMGMGPAPRQHGSGNQLRQTSGRGPQGGRPGGGKKTGGAPNHSGGNQAHGGKNRQGGHGNKRFK